MRGCGTARGNGALWGRRRLRSAPHLTASAAGPAGRFSAGTFRTPFFLPFLPSFFPPFLTGSVTAALFHPSRPLRPFPFSQPGPSRFPARSARPLGAFSRPKRACATPEATPPQCPRSSVSFGPAPSAWTRPRGGAAGSHVRARKRRAWSTWSGAAGNGVVGAAGSCGGKGKSGAGRRQGRALQQQPQGLGTDQAWVGQQDDVWAWLCCCTMELCPRLTHPRSRWNRCRPAKARGSSAEPHLVHQPRCLNTALADKQRATSSSDLGHADVGCPCTRPWCSALSCIPALGYPTASALQQGLTPAMDVPSGRGSAEL